MNPREWEKRLLGATAEVEAKVADLASVGGRGKSVGVGASGDRTILADKVAEDVLLESILGVEGVRVLSEEAGAAGEAGAETLAVVDPLDGSSNFERGIPFYCTSVAIVEGNSIEDVSVGVVRDLVSGDVYHAVKGRGARKNGRAVATSGVSDISKAVVGADLSRGTPLMVSGLAPLISGAKRHVHFGANALELCLLADGTIDAFVDARGKIRITDFAAAYLIAKEAGAEISAPDGGRLKASFDLERRLSFVATANSRLHREILGALKGIPGIG